MTDPRGDQKSEVRIEDEYLLCSVRAGCTHFHLRVLPGSPGLLIHAHGVFLPFEPIRRNSWSRNLAVEKKLLAACLCIGNSGLEMVWPSCYMWQLHRATVENVIPS